MYSRFVPVIRSERITADDFRVPPYNSGLHMPPSEVFLPFHLHAYTVKQPWMDRALLRVLGEPFGIRFVTQDTTIPQDDISQGKVSQVKIPQRKNAGLWTLSFLLCFVLTGFVLTENIVANSWGASLFTTHRHDFGRVVLGTDAEFQFVLTNTSNSDLRLVSLRSSCSCVSARFSTSILKSGETGAVIARLNTTGQHLHSKSSVLTVQLEMTINGVPRRDTVQLFVSGYIRPDVLLTPGSIEFGAVPEGTSAMRTLQMEYTGRPGWALTSVERSLPFIYARGEEIRRERGEVTYRITAILREDAPPGFVRDVLRFTTNELQPGRAEPVEVAVPVRGVVTATIQAKPSPIQIGLLAPGETAIKNIIVRNATPFRITDVTASDTRFRFAFSEQESTVQLITFAFSATPLSQEPLSQEPLPQEIAEVIRISTNDPRQETIVVHAFGRVREPDDGEE